jgi:hypothetical protein
LIVGNSTTGTTARLGENRKNFNRAWSSVQTASSNPSVRSYGASGKSCSRKLNAGWLFDNHYAFNLVSDCLPRVRPFSEVRQRESEAKTGKIFNEFSVENSHIEDEYKVTLMKDC